MYRYFQCTDPVYFNTMLLIIYLSAIETLICRTETSLIGSTSFGFAQNTIHDFQNTVINSSWHCLRQMPQKQKKMYLTEVFRFKTGLLLML